MWYLVGLPSYKNLSEVLREILGHCRAEIRQAEAPWPQLEKAEEERTRPLPTAATWQQRTPAMAAGLSDHIWPLSEWLTFPGVQRK